MERAKNDRLLLVPPPMSYLKLSTALFLRLILGSTYDGDDNNIMVIIKRAKQGLYNIPHSTTPCPRDS